MLRQLGAAYYQTLHGQGTPAEVARAVDRVAAADERQTETADRQAEAERISAGAQDSRLLGRRWQVRDVMTTEVASVDAAVPCKEAVQLMSEWTVSAIPVTDQDRRVLGMVSEADMLSKQERRSGRLALARRTRRKRAKATALTAGQMMTAPAITIRPDASLRTAARTMNAHRVRRLPVVDESGKLLGVVSRRDLLTAFLRTDDEIADDVRAVLTTILLEDPAAIDVSVTDGVVVLAGALRRPDLAPAAIRLASDIDGVVAVTDRLSHPATGG
jgi:CBS domain-containing protein